MKNLLITALLTIAFSALEAQSLSPFYKAEDSIKVEQLLREAQALPKGSNDVMFFARKFIDIPYVAATLEVAYPEQLVVNLRELDCTTFVETVTALTRTLRHGKSSFADYCNELQLLRYKDGKIEGYPSRLHYYSSWIDNGEKHHYVKEINAFNTPKLLPISADQKLNLWFMTQNANLYKALKEHPELLPQIKEAEDELNGKIVKYIPNAQLTNTKVLKKAINDGDILALVTKKGGLDVSHLGFAVWGNDGQLHLLNASSLHHKVIEEPKTLSSYMQSQKNNIGIRVIRIL